MAASGLSGDTLVACHFPLVPLPPWQLPVQALCSSARRPGRLCSAGLTRAVSLPERDSLSREHAAFAVDRHRFSSSHGSLSEDRAEEEGGSDSSGKYDSASSPEEPGVHRRKEGGLVGGGGRNSFLPWAEPEVEDEDGDGGNLDRYHEDSSFLLQGSGSWAPGGWWEGGGTLLGPDEEPGWFSQQADPLGDSLGVALKEDVSDSSCNSSDGVLVNFCTIYDRSNNPATPLDLGSPAAPPSPNQGSIFLRLQPVPSSAELESDGWSPSSGLDSNCNLFSLEATPPPGLSSLEASDLNACLRGPAALPTGTNQKYYKLVSCDLSSQSPSPAWSSHTSCPEAPSQSPFLLTTDGVDSQTVGQQGDVGKVRSGSFLYQGPQREFTGTLHMEQTSMRKKSSSSLLLLITIILLSSVRRTRISQRSSFVQCHVTLLRLLPRTPPRLRPTRLHSCISVMMTQKPASRPHSRLSF